MEGVVLNRRGFTLIELLIVISIIGILAGVVIGVINPQRQKDIATDAVTQSIITKFAAGIETFNSANGVYPTQEEFNEGTVSFINMDNKPEGLVYTVAGEVFYLCHVTEKNEKTFFVYDSSLGKASECDSSVENCGVYGCE